MMCYDCTSNAKIHMRAALREVACSAWYLPVDAMAFPTAYFKKDNDGIEQNQTIVNEQRWRLKSQHMRNA